MEKKWLCCWSVIYVELEAIKPSFSNWVDILISRWCQSFLKMNTVLVWITWEFFNYFFLSYGNWSSMKSNKVSNVTGELYRTKVFTVCSKITWKGQLPHSAAKEFKVQERLECYREGVCAWGVGWGGGGKHGYQKWFAWPDTFLIPSAGTCHPPPQLQSISCSEVVVSACGYPLVQMVLGCPQCHSSVNRQCKSWWMGRNSLWL